MSGQKVRPSETVLREPFAKVRKPSCSGMIIEGPRSTPLPSKHNTLVATPSPVLHPDQVASPPSTPLPSKHNTLVATPSPVLRPDQVASPTSTPLPSKHNTLVATPSPVLSPALITTVSSEADDTDLDEDDIYIMSQPRGLDEDDIPLSQPRGDLDVCRELQSQQLLSNSQTQPKPLITDEGQRVAVAAVAQQQSDAAEAELHKEGTLQDGQGAVLQWMRQFGVAESCPTDFRDHDEASSTMAQRFENNFLRLAPEQPKLPPETPREAHYRELLEAGCVKARTAAYVNFGKACKPGTELYKEYGACSDNVERNAFRLRWLQTKYDTLVKGREYKESYCRVNTDLGRYLPFYKVWEAEGFDNDGFQAAIKHCTKALRMGGCWIKWNNMTERIQFLHFESRLEDITQKSWIYWQKEHCDQREPEPEPKEKAEPDPANRPNKPKPKPKAAPKPEKAEATDLQKPKKAEATDLQKAMALKKDYTRATSLAGTMHRQISTSPEWDWANTDKTKQSIDDVLQPCFALNPFCRAFVTMEVRELKKSFTNEAFEQGLRDFLSLQKAVIKLQSRLDVLAGQHALKLKES